MSSFTTYGLQILVGSDVAGTAIPQESSTNANYLDASAGHIFQLNPASSTEEVWVTVNATFSNGTAHRVAQGPGPALRMVASAGGAVFLYFPVSTTAGTAVTYGTPLVTFEGLNTVVTATQLTVSTTPTGVTILNLLGTVSATYMTLANVTATALSTGHGESVSIIRGRVASNGTINSGAGFTINKTGTGAYGISFTNGFATPPAVIVTLESITPGYAQQAAAPTTLSTAIQTWNDSAGAADTAFDFLAIG